MTISREVLEESDALPYKYVTFVCNNKRVIAFRNQGAAYRSQVLSILDSGLIWNQVLVPNLIAPRLMSVVQQVEESGMSIGYEQWSYSIAVPNVYLVCEGR